MLKILTAYLLLHALFLALRRFGPKVLAMFGFFLLAAVGVYGVLRPISATFAGGVTVALAPFALLSHLWLLNTNPDSGDDLVERVWGHPAGKFAALALLCTVIPFGWAECATRFLTDRGLLSYYTPMQTVVPSGSEDWRIYHITADEFREPDPVLLWRPVDRAPYTYQRFKGPTVVVPKPGNVFRVMVYGDSNTDGPPNRHWPEHLQQLLDEKFPRDGDHTVEILNAGVAGYTSHQGLLRFKQEVEVYEPDMVMVSFGWNDAVMTDAIPDGDFEPPTPFQISMLRTLFKYRYYLTSKYYFSDDFEPGGDLRSRVDLEHYVENLRGFMEEGREQGVAVALMTRPHLLPPDELRKQASWRRLVPDYNERLVSFAKENGMLVLDAQQWFAEGDPENFSDEAHFSSEGRAFMARRVVEALERGNLLSNLMAKLDTAQLQASR